MHCYAGTPDEFAATLREFSTAYEAVHQMRIAADLFTNASTPRGCLLASATASGSVDAMDVQKAVAQVRSQMISRVCLRIEQDIAAGVLPADTNAKSLASLAIALVQGMSVLARDGGRREDLRDIVTVAMNAWPGWSA